MFLGSNPEVADARWPSVAKPHHSSIVPELETDDHHAEGDSKDGVSLCRGNDELRERLFEYKNVDIPGIGRCSRHSRWTGIL